MLPNATALVIALKTTALVSVDCSNPVFPRVARWGPEMKPGTREAQTRRSFRRIEACSTPGRQK
jgi:hypothetical protein